MIIVVSRGYIEAGGGLHDPKNPRNILFFEAANGFAKHVFGNDCLLASRMDHDEKGGGQVDVFVAPEGYSERGGRYLTSRPHLKNLQAKYDRRSACSALQDALAEFLQQNLDPSIQRGTERSCRGNDWLPPEVYGALEEIKKQNANLERDKAEFEEKNAELRASQDILERNWASKYELMRQREVAVERKEIENETFAAALTAKAQEVRKSAQQLSNRIEIEIQAANVVLDAIEDGVIS